MYYFTAMKKKFCVVISLFLGVVFLEPGGVLADGTYSYPYGYKEYEYGYEYPTYNYGAGYGYGGYPGYYGGGYGFETGRACPGCEGLFGTGIVYNPGIGSTGMGYNPGYGYPNFNYVDPRLFGPVVYPGSNFNLIDPRLYAPVTPPGPTFEGPAVLPGANSAIFPNKCGLGYCGY